MGTSYEDCDDDVREMLESLRAEFRPELDATEVTIRLQFAYGEDGKPALMHRGAPALGLCKINGLRERAQGVADATIYLDGDRWPDLSPRRRVALLHHELHHVQLGKGRDAAGRPRLKCRKHDIEMGLFAEIARMYREDSVEWAVIDRADEMRRQGTFDFGSAAAAAGAPPDAGGEPDGPDGWRDEDVSALCVFGLSDALLTKLDEAGVNTLGDLADFPDLTAIREIGESAAEKIAAAAAAWHAAHRPQSPDEAPDGFDDDEPEAA